MITLISPKGAAKLRCAGGGAQRLVFRVNEPKKTRARSTRTRSADITHLYVDCICS
jgi:hypothetical protein